MQLRLDTPIPTISDVVPADADINSVLLLSLHTLSSYLFRYRYPCRLIHVPYQRAGEIPNQPPHPPALNSASENTTYTYQQLQGDCNILPEGLPIFVNAGHNQQDSKHKY